MTTRSKRKKPGWLEVRVRRVASDGGTLATEMTVYCPFRREALPLKECTACEQCVGLSVDHTSRDWFLMCARAALEPIDESSKPAPLPEATDRASRTPVASIMNANVVCVRQDLAVDALAALLLARGISGAPVIDDDGRPVGVVSKTDLLRAKGAPAAADDPDDGAGLALEVRSERGVVVELGASAPVASGAPSSGPRARVREIMTPIVFSLPSDASVARAAALMTYERVHRLPVVGPDGEVVGIVSAMDVLRWLAHGAGLLRRERPDPH
jgi:CBS domain-containing protein